MRRFLSTLVVAATLAACGGGDAEDEPNVPGEECADVVGVEVRRSDSGAWIFDVSVRSGDTGWDKYADAWEVLAPDGTVLGTRVLTHPHVEEQPFTRSLGDVEVPPGVSEVTVRARDSVAGFCGRTATVEVGS